MITDADSRLREGKNEKKHQEDAEKRREAFIRLVNEVEESRNIDDTLAFLARETSDCANLVMDKLRESREAETEATNAITEMQEAVETARNAAEMEATKAKALKGANEALSNAEKDRDDSEKGADADPTDQKLKDALGVADKAVNEKKEQVAAATLDHQIAVQQKNDAEKKCETALAAGSAALAKAKGARDKEEAARNRWDTLRVGLKVARSRFTDSWLMRALDRLLSPQGITFCLMVVAVGGIWVLYRVLSKDFLDLIDDISVARGLITFMVAMITVTLAIVLSMYPIVSPGNKTEVEKADMKERFMLAKEVLMVFVGILGTIVGFYYASNHTGGAEALVPGLFFEPSDEVQSGEKVTLLSFMTTGTPPYKYEVSSDPKGIDKSGEDLDKFINVHVATPTGVLEDSIYTITLTITDSTGIKIPELQKQLKVRKRTSAALPVEPTPPLSIKLSTVEAGKNFTLEGNVGPESAYEITTDPPLKIGPSGSASVPPTKSDTGQVKAEFTVPPDSSPGPYKLTITVTDKAGTAKTFTMDLTVNSPSQPAG